MSCCNEAAQLLIKTLGGEEMCRRLVGGTKWWQVRGVQGVHGQWIAARKDWEESKRKRKEYEAKHKSRPPEEANVSHEYQPEMDQMRCLLFAHGGKPTTAHYRRYTCACNVKYSRSEQAGISLAQSTKSDIACSDTHAR